MWVFVRTILYCPGNLPQLINGQILDMTLGRPGSAGRIYQKALGCLDPSSLGCTFTESPSKEWNTTAPILLIPPQSLTFFILILSMLSQSMSKPHGIDSDSIHALNIPSTENSFIFIL